MHCSIFMRLDWLYKSRARIGPAQENPGSSFGLGSITEGMTLRRHFILKNSGVCFYFSLLATYLVLYLSEICFRFHGHGTGLYAQRHFTVYSSVNSDAINNSCFRMRLPALLKPLYFSLQLGSGTFLIIRCCFLRCWLSWLWFLSIMTYKKEKAGWVSSLIRLLYRGRSKESLLGAVSRLLLAFCSRRLELPGIIPAGNEEGGCDLLTLSFLP